MLIQLFGILQKTSSNHIKCVGCSAYMPIYFVCLRHMLFCFLNSLYEEFRRTYVAYCVGSPSGTRRQKTSPEPTSSKWNASLYTFIQRTSNGAFSIPFDIFSLFWALTSVMLDSIAYFTLNTRIKTLRPTLNVEDIVEVLKLSDLMCT